MLHVCVCGSHNHGDVLVLQDKGTEYSCRLKTSFSKVISSVKVFILGNTVTVAMNIIIIGVGSNFVVGVLEHVTTCTLYIHVVCWPYITLTRAHSTSSNCRYMHNHEQ